MEGDALKYQQQRWKSLKRTINEKVDLLSIDNVAETSRSLFQVNISKGKGLLVRQIMKRSLDDGSRNPQLAQFTQAVSRSIPEVGALLVKRLVLRFKQAFLSNDLNACATTLDFLGHLVASRVVNEILALEILQLLLRRPNEHTTDLACSFLNVVGHILKQESPEALDIILDRLNGAIHDNPHTPNHQRLFSSNYDVDLVVDPGSNEPLFIQLDEVMHAELACNVFSFDKNFDANENIYQSRRPGEVYLSVDDTEPSRLHVPQMDPCQRVESSRHADDNQPQGFSGESLLDAIMQNNTHHPHHAQQLAERGTAEGTLKDSMSATNNTPQTAKQDADENERVISAALTVTEAARALTVTRPLIVKDMSEQERMGHQKTIYLTIMSSMSADEAVHKLLRLRIGNLAQEKRQLLGDILIKCCIQEKTYSKYFGVVGEKLCRMSREWHATFAQLFAQYYNEIDQYETNGLRNVGKFFGHMLASDSLAIEASLCVVRLSEENTTSAGRVMLKFVFQEMVEELGVPELEARFVKDTFVKTEINGLFPAVNLTPDDCNRLRFAINFFTAIGLGVLTQEMRRELQALTNSRGRTLARQDRSNLGSESYSRSRSYSRSGSSRSRSYSRSRSPSELS